MSGVIATQSKYMYLTRSAGNHVQARHEFFWFCFWLDDKVAGFFEPIIHRSNAANQSKHMYLTRRAAKHVQVSHDFFGFASDWMKKWRVFFKPIMHRSNAVKPITFRHSNEYRSNDSWSQNVIGVPWSWRFVQRSLALFSFCKKLIQTKRIFFLLKLNRSVTPLSAICARELLVRLKPRDRRKVPITQQEKVYVTERISSSRNPSLYKRYMAIQWTATMKKPVEIQLRVVWLLVNNDKSLLSRLIKFTCLFARVFPSHHRTRLGRHSCWAGR